MTARWDRWIAEAQRCDDPPLDPAVAMAWVQRVTGDAAEDQHDYVARCPACGDVIDYCQGHGEIGDPAGFAILLAHDEGFHDQCHPSGCDERPS